MFAIYKLFCSYQRFYELVRKRILFQHCFSFFIVKDEFSTISRHISKIHKWESFCQRFVHTLHEYSWSIYQ